MPDPLDPLEAARRLKAGGSTATLDPVAAARRLRAPERPHPFSGQSEPITTDQRAPTGPAFSRPDLGGAERVEGVVDPAATLNREDFARNMEDDRTMGRAAVQQSGVGPIADFIDLPPGERTLDRAGAAAVGTIANIGGMMLGGAPGMLVMGNPFAQAALAPAMEAIDEHVSKPIGKATGSETVRAISNAALPLAASHVIGKALAPKKPAVSYASGAKRFGRIEASAEPISRVVSPQEAARIVRERTPDLPKRLDEEVHRVELREEFPPDRPASSTASRVVSPEEAVRIIRDRGPAPYWHDHLNDPAEQFADVTPGAALRRSSPPEPAGATQPAPPPEPLPAPMAETPKAINAKKWYHGTGTKGMTAEALDPSRTDAGSLFGQGVYFTDNPEVAQGYAKARSKRSGTPVVYEADLNVARPLRAEEPATPEIVALMEKASSELRANGYDVGLSEALNKPGVTSEELIQQFRRDLRSAVADRETDVEGAWAQMDGVTQGLRALGYDAVTHEGGKRAGAKMGGPRHQVVIPLPDETGTRLGSTVRGFRERVAPDPQAKPASIPETAAEAEPFRPSKAMYAQKYMKDHPGSSVRDAFAAWDALEKSPPREGPTLGSGGSMKGRPMGRESGAFLGIPGPKPLPDTLPPGTPAEMSAVAGVKERIRFGDEPKAPLGQRIIGGLKKVQSEMVRREAPLRNAEKDLTGAEAPAGVTAQAKFAQGSSQAAAKNLYEKGYLDEKTAPAVEPALKAVVKSGRRLSDVSAYATAKRAMLDYEPNKLESGFDPAEAQATIDLYEKNHPEVVAAADAIAEVNRQLRSNLAEADRWDPKRLADMEARNKYPIEFARQMGEDASQGSPGRRGAPMPGPRIKSRTGGDAPVRDPLVRLQENMRRMIAGADQARVKHSFLDMVRANPTKAAPLVEELTPAQLKAQIPDFDAIAQSVNPATDPGDFAKTFDAYDRAYKAGIISVETPGGGTKFLKVHDPALAKALQGGDYEYANALAKTAGAITAVQRTGITQVSPTFPLRNLIRDVGTYVAQSPQTNDLVLFKNLVRGLRHAISGEMENVGGNGTPLTEVAKRARGEGFFYADTTKAAPKTLARMEEGLAGYYTRRPQKIPVAAAKVAFSVWKSLNSGIEHAPRYAALIDNLEAQGWKPGQPLTRDMLVQAGNAFQESTVNFRLGGETGKGLNRYVFNFLNPAIQGIEQYRQTIGKQPGLATRRAITYGVAPAVGLYLWWQSDDKKRAAWERMKPWRRTMMNIPYGENEDGSPKYISLPVAQEAGSIFSATIAAMDSIGHGDGKRAWDEVEEIASRSAPGPLSRPFDWMSWVPSAVAPIAEVDKGKFAFSGRPINPRSMEGGELVSPADVRQPYSSKLGYMISDLLHWASGGVSKLTTADIDTLISGYGGTAARDALRTIPGGETEAADLPVIGTFSPRMSESRYVDDYYAAKAKFEGATNLSRGLRRTDPAKAREFRPERGVQGDLAEIDQMLKLTQDRYRAATAEVRPAIAKRLDALAQRGLRLLQSDRPVRAIGSGK